MRLLVTIILSLLVLAINSTLAISAESSIFSKVSGNWIFHAKYPGGCSDDFTTIKFIENNSRAEFTSSKPFKSSSDGKMKTKYIQKLKMGLFIQELGLVIP